MKIKEILNLEGRPTLLEVAKEYRQTFLEANPFPHIVLDNFINERLLAKCEQDFPDLAKIDEAIRHSGRTDEKLASPRGDNVQTKHIKRLLKFLNSSIFVDFLQILTTIEEPLITDPHYIGGGLHQIRRGGFLKIHADYCKHPETKLDRRLNLLIYLNKNWEESYGGHLELYDKDMNTCSQKILPIFNRMVIFNTNDYTYHGHPDPLQCPPDRIRKSLALYYFSNGR